MMLAQENERCVMVMVVITLVNRMRAKGRDCMVSAQALAQI
jgi:hypothetical protein